MKQLVVLHGIEVCVFLLVEVEKPSRKRSVLQLEFQIHGIDFIVSSLNYDVSHSTPKSRIKLKLNWLLVLLD